jgi:hypothetical protein
MAFLLLLDLLKAIHVSLLPPWLIWFLIIALLNPNYPSLG